MPPRRLHQVGEGAEARGQLVDARHRDAGPALVEVGPFEAPISRKLKDAGVAGDGWGRGVGFEKSRGWPGEVGGGIWQAAWPHGIWEGGEEAHGGSRANLSSENRSAGSGSRR